jgi:hypothetical protein
MNSRSALYNQSLIDAQNPHDILNWSSQFMVTPVELKHALTKVGASAAKVRDYFGLSVFEIWPSQPRDAVEVAASLE